MTKPEPSDSAQLDLYQRITKTLFNVWAVVLCDFVVVAVNTNLFNPTPNQALFGLLGVSLVLLSQPMIKRWAASIPIACYRCCIDLRRGHPRSATSSFITSRC